MGLISSGKSEIGFILGKQENPISISKYNAPKMVVKQGGGPATWWVGRENAFLIK
jgi:hypothetical protein